MAGSGWHTALAEASFIRSQDGEGKVRKRKRQIEREEKGRETHLSSHPVPLPPILNVLMELVVINKYRVLPGVLQRWSFSSLIILLCVKMPSGRGGGFFIGERCRKSSRAVVRKKQGAEAEQGHYGRIRIRARSLEDGQESNGRS